MDPSVTDGLTVTVIGVSTVFLALASLNRLVAVLNRLGDQAGQAESAAAVAETPAEGPSEVSATEPESTQEAVKEEETDLTLVALAAYGLHRGHRVESGSAGEATPWVYAGRTRQTAPFQR